MPAGPHQKKFKPELVQSILDKISKHIPYKKACLRVGVTERMFYYWIDTGEKDLEKGIESDHSKFVMALNEIEVKRMEGHLNNIERSKEGHKGSQWILERVFWKHFSPKVADIDLNERIEKLEANQKNKGEDNVENNSKKK